MKLGDFTVSEGHGYPLVYHIIIDGISKFITRDSESCCFPWIVKYVHI